MRVTGDKSEVSTVVEHHCPIHVVQFGASLLSGAFKACRRLFVVAAYDDDEKCWISAAMREKGE